MKVAIVGASGAVGQELISKELTLHSPQPVQVPPKNLRKPSPNTER